MWYEAQITFEMM